MSKPAVSNFPDTLIIQGKYQFKPEMPFSPAANWRGVIWSEGGVNHLETGRPWDCLYRLGALPKR